MFQKLGLGKHCLRESDRKETTKQRDEFCTKEHTQNDTDLAVDDSTLFGVSDAEALVNPSEKSSIGEPSIL